ncbi:unnamed protein product [Adineta steineri]|uniref:HTH OST-type domain-containing protein n=1 Tax=Adineta steineri TaxID=433720 RepID=A0A813TDJ9_9BILA|nr:unnamed protein product [Adineta steineri]CAF3753295.1 unnamed protein product [Adineta steineri]
MACQTSPLYEQTKNEIIQLFISPNLYSVDGGLTLTELCREYSKRYEDRNIPHQELGFETLTRLLKTMGDVIKLNYEEWPAKCYLISKANEEEKSESSQKKLYEETKNRLVQLLMSSPLLSTDGGLTLTELCQEYKRCYGNAHIPHEEFGFEKLTRFLRSMKDLIQMKNDETPMRLYLATKVKQDENRLRKVSMTTKIL